jgi:hypothetical protein
VLCPPSVSSKPELLQNSLSSLDRSVTDVQMLDRLAMGLVVLPSGVYSSVLILSDTTPSQELEKHVLENIFKSMLPKATVRSQQRDFGKKDTLGVLMAGFMIEKEGPGEDIVLVKPDFQRAAAVPLRLRKKECGSDSNPIPAEVVTAAEGSGSILNGVGFVEIDFDDLEDEELVDEETLLDDGYLGTPIRQRMFRWPLLRSSQKLTQFCPCSPRMRSQTRQTQTSL